MTHVFFQKNDNFETVEQFDSDQFIVEIAFAPDSPEPVPVFKMGMIEPDPSPKYVFTPISR